MARRFSITLVLVFACTRGELALGQAFTYQGHLKDANGPVNGTPTLVFKLFNALNGGNQLGNTLIFNAEPVTQGLFTVSLDFGAGNLAFFTGDPRWLDISVNGTPLAPRQPISPAAYALRSIRPWQTSNANGNDIFFSGNTLSTGGNVGIGDSNPTTLLSVGSGHKFQVDGTHGSVRFTDAAASIIFPDTTNPFSPLIQLFDAGTTTANRMIFAHSTSNPFEGLMFSSHRYLFRSSAGKIVLDVDVNTPFVGINRTSPLVGTDAFCVDSPASDGELGGMFVNTASATALAYYGYAAGGSPHAWTCYDGSSSNWQLYNNGMAITVASNRNVGIGTIAPAVKLQVDGGADASPGGGGYLVIGATSGSNMAFDNNEIMARNNGVSAPLYLNDAGGDVCMSGLGSGNVGIGTDSPAAKLQIVGGTDASMSSGGYLVLGPTSGANMVIDNNEIIARSNGATTTLYLNNSGGDVNLGGPTTIKGNLTVRSASSNAVLVELGEGLDYAEGFNTSEKEKTATPAGSVMVIDAAHPGQLTLSTRAYDKRVAGIVAGAKGLGSAVRLGAGRFDVDVALAGRVYCFVDATEAGVEPGDLLTTSATPGHAMKVADPQRAMGAVLGKAMEPLKQGEKGQILVLVTLQ